LVRYSSQEAMLLHEEIKSRSDQPPLLIFSQKRKLLLRLMKLWLGLFFCVLLSYHYFAIVGTILILWVLVYYFLFSKDWSRHRYSLILLHGLTAMCLFVFAAVAGPIRSAILVLVRGY